MMTVTSRDPVRDVPRHNRVEATGIEPANLLHAMQALYQLSYAPTGVATRLVATRLSACHNRRQPPPACR
jgi:hypothetical protein